MKASLVYALSLSALLLAACAAEPAAQATSKAPAAADQPKAAATAAADNDTICTREYPTGSNIPLTKCRTRAQVEAEKAAAEDSMRRVQTSGPAMKKGG
jgi:hypothetical protein